jgi:hypothetical protein
MNPAPAGRNLVSYEVIKQKSPAVPAGLFLQT